MKFDEAWWYFLWVFMSFEASVHSFQAISSLLLLKLYKFNFDAPLPLELKWESCFNIDYSCGSICHIWSQLLIRTHANSFLLQSRWLWISTWTSVLSTCLQETQEENVEEAQTQLKFRNTKQQNVARFTVL